MVMFTTKIRGGAKTKAFLRQADMRLDIRIKQLNRDAWRRLNLLCRCAGTELAKNYRRELRQHSPYETGELEKSIRVDRRCYYNRLYIAPHMNGYGFILNARLPVTGSSDHYQWIDDRRRVAESKAKSVIQRCAYRVGLDKFIA